MFHRSVVLRTQRKLMWKACNAHELLFASHNFTLYRIMQLHYVLQKNKDTPAKDHCKYPYVALTPALKGRLECALGKITEIFSEGSTGDLGRGNLSKNLRQSRWIREVFAKVRERGVNEIASIWLRTTDLETFVPSCPDLTTESLHF